MGPGYGDGMKDYSKQREAFIPFRIGTNEYHAITGLPAQILLDFAAKFGSMETGVTPVAEQVQAFTEMLELVLEPDSMALFLENMKSTDTVNMIEIDQIDRVLTDLVEEYGLRPTQPSSPSADGPPSPEPGTSLTGSSRDVVSISDLSLPIGS